MRHLEVTIVTQGAAAAADRQSDRMWQTREIMHMRGDTLCGNTDNSWLCHWHSPCSPVGRDHEQGAAHGGGVGRRTTYNGGSNDGDDGDQDPPSLHGVWQAVQERIL